MNKKIKATKMGFADARFRAFEMANKTLAVTVDSWEEKTIRIVFSKLRKWMNIIQSEIVL